MKEKKVGVVKCGCLASKKCAKMWYESGSVLFRDADGIRHEMVINNKNVADLLGLYLVALADVVKSENEEKE